MQTASVITGGGCDCLRPRLLMVSMSVCVCVTGATHEADEGAAGEEPDVGIPQEPRDRLPEEGPEEAGGKGSLERWNRIEKP